MTDPWQFWQEQLAGRNPETTPGTPHAGYYINRNRQTYRNPNPRPGDPRHKVSTTYEPVAIWHDDAGWHCMIHGKHGIREMNDTDAIDNLFSYVCRTAIPYMEYIDRVAEYEKEYSRELV